MNNIIKKAEFWPKWAKRTIMIVLLLVIVAFKWFDKINDWTMLAGFALVFSPKYLPKLIKIVKNRGTGE